VFRIPVAAAGRLSTMPRPKGDDWLDDEMVALRAAGVDVLVSLQTHEERVELGLVDEPEAAVRAGLEFLAFPIADLGVPDRHEIEPFLATLRDRLDAGRHVVVHCRAGIGRSSLVAAALLTRYGVPPDEAWAVISEARGISVPETAEQGDWLRRADRL
jgi:protein-tyrosine phosphatase